jgi:hypothetical protein
MFGVGWGGKDEVDIGGQFFVDVLCGYIIRKNKLDDALGR